MGRKVYEFDILIFLGFFLAGVLSWLPYPQYPVSRRDSTL